MIKHLKAGLLSSVLVLGTIVLLYACPREDFVLLFSLFTGLFAAYLLAVFQAKETSLTFWIALAVILRIIAAGSMPELSDDYWRYLWDGKLQLAGLNPLSQLPQAFAGTEFMQQNQVLFDGMNSQGYMTVYPPINQAVFTFSAWFFPKNVYAAIVSMKAILVLFELGSLAFIWKLLQHYKLPKCNILIYALNPLIWIELIGNVHFESGLIFFMLGAIYFFIKDKTAPTPSLVGIKSFLLANTNLAFAGIFLGLAICTKLWPLMFLPFFFFYEKNGKRDLKSGFLVSVIALGVTTLLFLAAFRLEIFQIFSGLQLYIRSFEFNASLYYLLRWIGFQITGYNLIQGLGPILMACAGISILAYSYFRRNGTSGPSLPKSNQTKSPIRDIAEKLTWTFMFFLVSTTTIMPWYVTILIAFSVFSRYRFPIVWSWAIMLSYTHYIGGNFQEHYGIILLEYSLVCGMLIFEYFQDRNRRMQTV